MSPAHVVKTSARHNSVNVDLLSFIAQTNVDAQIVNRKADDNESSSEDGSDSLDEDGEFSDEFTDTEYESDDN